ncbi:MAG: isopeptide-forming domain-containing fimbrial protein, partial [Coriobacteriia bacterium]|nr:isopeptide-forming domain-containing fimbrial protein [Coriobacteriia bacterium]
NAAAGYDVYQLFLADIEPDSTSEEHPGVATHVSWASDTVKNTVLAFLDDNGYDEWLAGHGHTDSASHDLPQNAAEFIAECIGASPNDEQAATAPPTKAAESFALELAKALSNASGVPMMHADADAVFSGSEGYYLFVTQSSTIDVGEAGTAPIWVPLGGATTTLAEKTAIPSLTKEVQEDSSGQFGKVADGNKDQELAFRLEAKMPQNIGAFDTYEMRFEDTLPSGMDLEAGNTSSVVVKVDGIDITADLQDAQGSISFANHELIVHINDVKSVHAGLSVDKDTAVTVEYRAHINASSAIGAPGETNTAKLRYTNDPVSSGLGTTVPVSTTTYTYQLKVNKVDKQTGENLARAGFKVQVSPESTDAASRGKWIAQDGSLVEESQAYEFTTDSEGVCVIPRIDEGVYIIKETTAPSGYETQDADIVVTLTRTFEGSALQTLDATCSGGEAADSATTDVATHIVSEPAQTGTVELITSDDKTVSMPITGMDGVTAALIYGSCTAVLGLVGWRATRKSRDDGLDSHLLSSE